MSAETFTKDIRSEPRRELSNTVWVQIGLITGITAVVLVIIIQMLALAIWPEAASFKPLDSYARTAVFTLIPALAAAALFARLSKSRQNPATSFLKISIVVLLLSIIPDYLLPDPNITLLASTITAFMHVVAAAVITGGLILGYRAALKNS